MRQWVDLIRWIHRAFFTNCILNIEAILLSDFQDEDEKLFFVFYSVNP